MRGALRFLSAVTLGGGLFAYTADLTPARKAALDRISAKSLEAHVSFLASDALDGRDTPSPGLNVAAEYIASQFRRAGLKPAGDNDYFQTAHFVATEQSAEGAEVGIHAGALDLKVATEDLRVIGGGANLADALMVKIDPGSATAAEVEGKIIVLALDRPANRVLATVLRLKPVAMVLALPSSTPRAPEVLHRLEDGDQRRASVPVIRIYNGDLFKFVNEAKTGPLDARITAHVPAPLETPVTLRNVAGILPGTDPALRNTYVMVSAHYDHLGKIPEGEGDLIYNGANDDASGVASVLELASALSADRAPRRSVLFIAFFGEEKGLLGSRYYANHPLVPLNQTVADLNLEQVGRFSSDRAITMTGFGYSDLADALKLAASATGVKVFDPGKQGDDYFALSDNLPLAEKRVPAHTIAATFEFPDYHQVGDEWEKLDYTTFVQVTRAIGLTVFAVADDQSPPHWRESYLKSHPASESATGGSSGSAPSADPARSRR